MIRKYFRVNEYLRIQSLGKSDSMCDVRSLTPRPGTIVGLGLTPRPGTIVGLGLTPRPGTIVCIFLTPWPGPIEDLGLTSRIGPSHLNVLLEGRAGIARLHHSVPGRLN